MLKSSSLGQEELPGFPYRMSAIITSGDKPLGNVKVQILNPKTKAVLQEKATDGTGQVYFDRPSSDEVTVRPVVTGGLLSIPEEVTKSPTPISRWYWNAWDWEGDSVRFQIGKASGDASAPPGDVSDLFSARNILIAGVAAVVLYFVFRKNS